MAREHRDFINASAIAWEAVPDGPFAGAARRGLSADRETGAQTAVVRLPAGWSAEARELDGALELLSLRGEVTLAGRTVPDGGWARMHASAAAPMACAGGAEILVMTDPAPAGASDAVVVDVRGTPWGEARRGGPGAILVKPLADGPIVSFVARQRPGSTTGAEFHECPEELYVLDGDVTGRYGTMTAGSYFWRPEYITHGPYSSDAGLVCFVRGHGAIFAHWIDDADATVEQNRAYAATLSSS